MGELLQRVFVFCVVLFVTTLVGNWLYPRIDAGQWWALIPVVVGGLLLSYVVAEPDERQEFRDAPRLIGAWFVNLPASLACQIRSYWRRA